LLRGNKEVLVRGVGIFNGMYPLIEHYAANKDNNAIITGFFCCIYCDFKGLMCIDINLYYSASGPKDVGTLNLIIYWNLNTL